MSEPIMSKHTLIAVGLTLLALTAVSVGVSFVDLGVFNSLVALGIATIKAGLILMFFMQARRGPRLTWLVIGAGLLWFGILFVGTMDDYLTRTWLPGGK